MQVAVKANAKVSGYKNQEEYLKDIERVFLEDYNISLSPLQIEKIGEGIKNICVKYLA